MLPDGQELDVIVNARERTPDGRWWYECEAILPDRRRHPDGRTEPAAVPTPLSVHADRIAPLPGEDYTSVPTTGAVAGRRWLLARVPPRAPDDPGWRLHRGDCGQASGEQRRITEREAARLLGAGADMDVDVDVDAGWSTRSGTGASAAPGGSGGPGAPSPGPGRCEVCAVCRPDRALPR